MKQKHCTNTNLTVDLVLLIKKCNPNNSFQYKNTIDYQLSVMSTYTIREK